MAWIKGVAPKTMHDQFGIYNGLWMPEMDRCWVDYDRGYQVLSRMIYTKQFGNVEHVSISKIHPDDVPTIRTGGVDPIGWNEKMMIKDELFGKNRFAIEVYPKDEYLIDVTDTYHLWVFDKKLEMPFGIHPKEHRKAINRGALPLTKEELVLLQEKNDAFHSSCVGGEQ